MSALQAFITDLHGRVGICGHCGEPTCPDRDTYSLLPNTISVEDFVAYVSIANRVEAALHEMLELHGGYSYGDEPKAHQVARELLGALVESDHLSPDDAEFGMSEHRASHSELLREIAARLSHSGYDQERDELIDIANAIRNGR